MELFISNYIVEIGFLDVAIVMIIFLAVFIYIKIKLARTGKITRSLNMIVLQVFVPREAEEQSQNKGEKEKENISVMEQLFASLSNIREEMLKKIIYGPFYLSFEIATPVDSNEIFFYISVPKKFQSIIEKQIHSFYADAEITQIEDYNIYLG